MNHFFILGNGGGGTSLLRGLLNAHSDLDVRFEFYNGKPYEEIFMEWEKDRVWTERKGYTWGNKVPVEQFKNNHWTDEQLLRILSEGYKVIWITRRFTRYQKSDVYQGKNFTKDFMPLTADAMGKKYWEMWSWTRMLYWKFKEQAPERVMQVSFEDLILRPIVELSRLCIFLETHFQSEMLKGTENTGYTKYDQVGINLSKV